MKSISIIKYAFAVIGLGMLVGAFFLFITTQDFLKGAQTADGTVIELVRSRSKSSDSVSYTYRPVVEFITPGGKKYEFMSSIGSNPASYSKGEIVEIIYPESSPEQAKLNFFFSVWSEAIIFGFLGLIFSVVGFSMILLRKL